jgi:hypothetical protein
MLPKSWMSTVIIRVRVVAWLLFAGALHAQTPDAPSLQQPAASLSGTGTASPLSSATTNNTAPSSTVQRGPAGPLQLPNNAGQFFQEYDLRPYTRQLNQVDRPQQAIIDWVLRETGGTDAWHGEPFGFFSADRDTLRVYHTQQMHELVKRIHENFVNGTTAPQMYNVRLMAVANPNWRTRAFNLLRSVKAQSTGVNAFLLTKENNAMLLAMLRGRTDFKELAAADVVVHNGQVQTFEQVRGRNFVENQQPANGFPPYLPIMGEIKEGYHLQLSPLLSIDHKTVDLMVKCEIDQVERLANVNLELPTTFGQTFNTQIQVPQLVSWRLLERFRWPSDQVLLLSCGVVAAPQGSPDNSLLGSGGAILGLNRIIPGGGGDRADALLMIEYKGDATGRFSTGQPATPGTAALNPLSRGRY